MPKQTKKNVAYVICDVNNSGVFLEKVTSTKPITLDRVVKFYAESRAFDWDEDSITLVQPEDLDVDMIDLDAEGV